MARYRPRYRNYRTIEPVSVPNEDLEPEKPQPKRIKKMSEKVTSDQDRFDVTWSFSAKNSAGDTISDAEVNWNDCGYDALLMLERVLIEALMATNDAGIERAKGVGKGAALENFFRSRGATG